jgi:hypothetical protein
VIPFFNGTLANTQLPEHVRFGHRWEAKTRTGHPYYAGDWARHNADAPSRNRAMLHHEIAPCKEQRAYFLETILRIVRTYRFGNAQLDQISEKMLVDYNEDHVETTPDRVYVDGLAALLPQVRETVRAANPDGVVLSEAPNEFTGQWCDGSWDWTALMPFPEPILYALPWLFTSHEIDALEYGEVNKAFAYKMYLDMKIDGGDAAITKYPAFAAHVKALADLRKRVAPYYVYANFRDQEGIAVRAGDNVLAKIFVNRETHKAGIVLCEHGGKQATVVLRSQWEASSSVFHFDSSTGDNGALPLGEEMSLKLQPYEVGVLCVDLAGHPLRK